MFGLFSLAKSEEPRAKRQRKKNVIDLDLLWLIPSPIWRRGASIEVGLVGKSMKTGFIGGKVRWFYFCRDGLYQSGNVFSSIKVSNVNHSDTVAPYLTRRENEKVCLVALFIQNLGVLCLG